MTTWGERMQSVVACGQPSIPYPRRIEKVKFGVRLEQVCKNDIPAPLLVLILKLNKEGPGRRDIFRAPGHQGDIKKLVYFLQNGRLINIDRFPVYTIASVLKKFLRKLPNGIFGREIESELFSLFEGRDPQYQRQQIHQLILSMPTVTQHLLVLLFGTFRVIALNANKAETGMSSEALGVSVAPSFFQLCVADGKTACMDDVIRFKVATQIMKFLIDNFGISNLFGRQNYEYYARITGRILKVENDWIFAFRYPPETFPTRYSSTLYNFLPAAHDESQSTPALIHIPECLQDLPTRRLLIEGQEVPLESSRRASCHKDTENSLKESCTRLSISLEENGLYKVHERQTERMHTRSDWFLSPLGHKQLYVLDSNTLAESHSDLSDREITEREG